MYRPNFVREKTFDRLKAKFYKIKKSLFEYNLSIGKNLKNFSKNEP